MTNCRPIFVRSFEDNLQSHIAVAINSSVGMH